MQSAFIKFGFALSLCLALVKCGGTGTGNPVTNNVLVQSNPLSGPGAALLSPRSAIFSGYDLLAKLFQIQSAFASVSTFASFKVCNDTMKFIDINGNVISIDGASSVGVGTGLISFSPTSTTPMTIGSLKIEAGTAIKEIDITLATVPSVCQGANYAVQFDDGTHGPINITQNTAFKFMFPGSGVTVVNGLQTFTLLFGQIVNGMVSLGAGLNNSSIQTVNVGQAQ